MTDNWPLVSKPELRLCREKRHSMRYFLVSSNLVKNDQNDQWSAAQILDCGNVLISNPKYLQDLTSRSRDKPLRAGKETFD